MQPAEGIAAVWVNGELSWQQRQSTGVRAGRFLPRGARPEGGTA
jgi:amidohydrolase/N-acyl-D-amino-acid deacylase